MKKLALILVVSFSILMGCEKEELKGTELASLNLLSVGVDGNTDVSVDNLKMALLGDVEVTDDETAGLLLMREEEKLASDLYTGFNELYDLRIFSNISRSENTHMAAVLVLLDAFGLEDPASDERGVFTNTDLQEAYNQLKASGDVSLVEALKVGAYVEELDILDLEEQLAATTNEDIKLTYENLLRGSRNHLRAFTRVLAQNGVGYTPQLLTDEYYQEVINGGMEKGNSGSCALGYGYANRSGKQNRAKYQSQDCDSAGTATQQGQGKQYRKGKGGN